MADIKKITRDNKALFLAYDQGLEHGLSDFNDVNVDPYHILSIGLQGEYTGIIFQKGVAEKYYDKKYRDKLPLILKLNGKTNLLKTDEPFSPLLSTVSEALELGAAAVGYTVYVGSEYENLMLSQLGEIVKEAHQSSLPVIAWMYPRGKSIKDSHDPEVVAYAARIGLEIGADIVKTFYPGDLVSVRRVVEGAGKTGVVFSGGKLEKEEEFLEIAKTVITGGALGLAVGRNIWQRDDPLSITSKLKEIVFQK